MIKLIASDLDGTLLKEGTMDINPEIYDIIRKLKAKGIVFAAVCKSGTVLPLLGNLPSPDK
jgi:hydroxymethylpyrimidine pyrophosphatase-like HAD family hydrolase